MGPRLSNGCERRHLPVVHRLVLNRGPLVALHAGLADLLQATSNVVAVCVDCRNSPSPVIANLQIAERISRLEKPGFPVPSCADSHQPSHCDLLKAKLLKSRSRPPEDSFWQSGHALECLLDGPRSLQDRQLRSKPAWSPFLLRKRVLDHLNPKLQLPDVSLDPSALAGRHRLKPAFASKSSRATHDRRCASEGSDAFLPACFGSCVSNAETLSRERSAPGFASHCCPITLQTAG
jgi:hypothetical protein